MSKHSFKSTLIVLALLDLVALGAWFVLLTRAQAESITYAKESGELLAEDSKGVYLATAKRDLRTSEADRRYLSGIFVEEGAEVLFLERVEALAKHSAVEVKIVDFAKRPEGLHLVVQTTGIFQNSRYFLRLVEALPLALSVDSITFDSGKDEKGKVIWQGQYQMTLWSYLIKKTQ